MDFDTKQFIEENIDDGQFRYYTSEDLAELEQMFENIDKNKLAELMDSIDTSKNIKLENILKKL